MVLQDDSTNSNTVKMVNKIKKKDLKRSPCYLLKIIMILRSAF